MDVYHHSSPTFTQWIVSQRLLTEPFVIIDIGVQGGEHPRWQFLGSYAEIHGFDPIAEVIDELQESGLGLCNRYYHNLALGDEDGEREFFVIVNRFSSSFYKSNTEGETSRRVTIRRLDSLFRDGTIPCADYIKLDCEGFEPEVLRGAREYLTASDVLCVTSETNFNVSPVLPSGHFAAINEIMADHRLIVYDLNLVRHPTTAYTAALGANKQPSPHSFANSPLALGRIGTCDAVFCRDFVGETTEPDRCRGNKASPRQPTTDTIIKSMINFELHGLMDCAVDLAQHFRSLLVPRLDVDRAIALLLLPAPHPRNTADVTLARASQAAELETVFEAERKASIAQIKELRDQLDGERKASIAQIKELRNQLDAERKASIARIQELRNQLDAERKASIARIQELQAQLDAEHKAFIARIQALDSQLDGVRSAFLALVRPLVRRYRLFRWLNECRKQLRIWLS